MLITGTPLSSRPCVSVCRPLDNYHARSPSDRCLRPPPSTRRPCERCLSLCRPATRTPHTALHPAAAPLNPQ